MNKPTHIKPADKEASTSQKALWGFAAPDHYIFHDSQGDDVLHLMVGGMKCAGCMRNIEGSLAGFDELKEARVNLSTQRLILRWKRDSFDPVLAINAVIEKGFQLAPFDPEALSSEAKAENKTLLIAMAVAGFATANVMMLSVAVWAGGSSMSHETRALFHWLSALIALPTIMFSGRVFFRSGLNAIMAGRLNMDVPISLAVILASGMSLYETSTGGDHAYFDAAVSLLFFLLIGRYLDHQARTKARSQGEHLLALQAMSATVIGENGEQQTMPLHLITPGMVVLVAVGEKIPVDGMVVDGASEVDNALVTGESQPIFVEKDSFVYAGTLNLLKPLRIEVKAVGEETLLGEIARLMEAAEQGRGVFVRIADRVAGLYAPVVHTLGLLTFLGWWLVMGVVWQEALLYATAVLIITCPCALALAVPVVQVVASGRLMRGGILLKSADALERARNIDLVVFDKTGTLTLGRLKPLFKANEVDDAALHLASGMAANSVHPLAKALHATSPYSPVIDNVEEIAGKGLLAVVGGAEVRLGSAKWCGVAQTSDDSGAEIWLKRGDKLLERFSFSDTIRSDAKQVVEGLQAQGIKVALLSGDRKHAVESVAGDVGIADYYFDMLPQDKVAWIEDKKQNGAKVLMVGDGL
ncbi:MAG: heavy metal translocating P-type ATPase, partial [Sphingomonadales bacterium]|nr:heavy metal translocating P-type ATPase [Sphingomonadales bacterium]